MSAPPDDEEYTMSFGGRLSVLIGLFVVAVGFALWGVFGFLLTGPPTVDFTSAQTPSGTIDMTVQTVPAIGFGPQPVWVSYLVMNPAGHWIHSTVWKLPAHTRINMTIYQYDSGSPLRNQNWGRVQGTAGGFATYNGKPITYYDSNTGNNGVGHTFSVPAIGLSVPLIGVNGNATNTCGAAPCTTNFAHNTMKFSFTTPGAGSYNWQCFVPCGGGYLYGNGGPMSTLGYMGGFLDVVNT
jgi:hypothetical protein